MSEHQTNSTSGYYVSKKLYEKLAAALVDSEREVLNSRAKELHQIQYSIGKADGLRHALDLLKAAATNKRELPNYLTLWKDS